MDLLLYLPFLNRILKKIKKIFNLKCIEQEYLPLLKIDIDEISDKVDYIYNKFKSLQ